MDNTCPECGEKCDRVAVDIGVGTQFGPAWCPFCGWSEADPTDAALLADICDNMAEVLKPLPGEE